MNDSWETNPSVKGKPHPRTYGALSRVLSKYVREKRLMRLEEAIQKMAFYLASIMRIKDRGLLREGHCADITIFDPDKIVNCATYRFPLGMHYVIINGKIAVEKLFN